MLPELVFARGLKAWRVEWMMGCDFSRNLRSLFPMHPLMSLGIQDLVFALPSGPSNTEFRGTAGLLRHPPRNWSLIPVGVPRWGRWISGALISTPTSTRRKGALPWFCAVPQNDSSWRYSKWDPKHLEVDWLGTRPVMTHDPAVSRTCGITPNPSGSSSCSLLK